MPGREAVLPALRQIDSLGDLETNVSFAMVDPELFALLQDAQARATLRRALLEKWFLPAQIQSLLSVMTEERDVESYAELIKANAEGYSVQEAPLDLSLKARDEGFRRCVRDAYDNRCAASGWRIVLATGRSAVEAAHLIPWEVSRDDDPRNGIALTRTYHWLMDQNVIAPGLDLK